MRLTSLRLYIISTSPFAAGQKIGVCGPSGAGKSSFVALLLHMLEVNEGSIAIDGVDLLNIPRRVLREHITVIPQEPIFLKGTTVLDKILIPQTWKTSQPLRQPSTGSDYGRS
jgi:ABC-type multidrug transport system fused ATPase/permease subunit